MAGTVVAVFADHHKAEEAAQALLDEGVSLGDIALVAKNAGGETGAHTSPTPQEAGATPPHSDRAFLTSEVREVPEHDVERVVNTHDEAIARAVVGFVIGGPIVSILVALLSFFPSLWPFLTAHPLAPQLGGGLLGSIVGAIIGATTAGGIPPEAARAYHAHVERGATLVTTLSSSRNAPHFQDILRQHGGRELGFFTRFIDSVQSVESEPAAR